MSETSKRKTSTRKAPAGLQTILENQRTIYRKSLSDHRLFSSIIILVLTVCLMAILLVAAWYIVRINRTHQQDIKIIMEEYEEARMNIINTAFDVKDYLLGEYYVGSKKQFEDFILVGAKIITQTYSLRATAIKAKKFTPMTKQEMKNYLELTYAGGELVGIDPYLLLAMDYEESKFDKRAISSAGARGISQIMPLTGKLVANARTNYAILQLDSYDLSKLFDPIYNKKIHIRYMKHLFDEFDGRVEWALLAYNTGPTRTLGRWWNEGADLFSNLNTKQQEYANLVLGTYNNLKINGRVDNSAYEQK